MNEQVTPPASTDDEPTTADPSDARPSRPDPADPAPTDPADPAPADPAPADPAPGDAAPADPAGGGEGAADEATPGGWSPWLRVLTVLGVVAALVGALVLVGLRYDVAGRLLAVDPTADARAGDCLGALPEVAESGGRRAARAQVVACSSAEAAYDVVGRVDGLTREQVGDDRRCEPFVAAGGTYYTYSSLPDDGSGYLLCLVPRS
ncbi:hypothetical protein O7606_14180 [Micromonospora sp. WMMD882]|uniref:LppU/SCO3897 family protein n=1 Tax=Micromonospora sp. WMMD882 TaxID=3015151 RepID=UPI00248AF911|nr:hypothetical protein [Micromonospora sp. WMMD882]WBB77437.1 hypothetical protein O7606_14180 [Micromonospora sp. WMMD882]